MKYSLKFAETGGFPILFIGLFISFCGSVAPGIINIAAMQVSVQRGWSSGLAFSFGAMAIEIIAVFLLLQGNHILQIPKKWFYWVEVLKVTLLLALALGCFKAAAQPASGVQSFAWLNTQIPALLIGIGLRLIVPTMVPFWIGWNTALRAQRMLVARKQYPEYLIGIGLGTLLAHSLYILFSSGMTRYMEFSHFWINILLGTIFAVLFVLQISKLLKERFTASFVP